MPQLTGLLRSEWDAELARNGLSFVPPKTDSSQEGGVACPACGTVGPLDDGACSDCGLALG